MNTDPTGYASSTLSKARLKMFGQLFNVIGNGIDNYETFAEKYLWTPGLAAMTSGFPQKYIGNETLYEGYPAKKLRVDNGEKIDTTRYTLFTEAEKEFHPEFTQWTAVNRLDTAHKPYPNFQSNYSLLHRIDINQLDESWLYGGIEYYEYCRKYFDSDDSSDYHSAWPTYPQKQRVLVNSYSTAMSRCIAGIEDVEAQWAAISKAYGTPYKGDTVLFIQERGATENARIHTFIDETIDMLGNNLANRQKTGLSL